MKCISIGFPVLFLSVVMVTGINAQQITLVDKSGEKKIEVLVDGKLFTAYIFPETIMKPVLWPLISPGGNTLTRNYPLKKKAGERVDHPHHVGIWLNYGNVNGLDFWNNSEAIPEGKRGEFGTILHKSVEKLESGAGKATLAVKAVWVNSRGDALLDEETTFVFSVKGNVRIIDRETKLTALTDVLFEDNKEGMFGMRVARELELPEGKPLKLTDSHGTITKVSTSGSSEATGNYLSSEGVEGAGVWGTRARWMELYGKVNGEDVAIVIAGHPGNVGYPTYWHARGYGLFAANPLGQKIFSKGKKELNFKLKKGESTTFNYRVMVFSGTPTVEEVNKLVAEYTR
ncbi:FIG00908826: hypothetical protein [hydrothermal vent metagenome]|uniref:Methane oxygenase PmoA n=1 Tax=hydrothermal vent metagenome TaxID=652676 RepID=A0A3B0THJ9_9ZZZZ